MNGYPCQGEREQVGRRKQGKAETEALSALHLVLKVVSSRNDGCPSKLQNGNLE